jgi:ligand-binding SRPBCC domain-containing protein
MMITITAHSGIYTLDAEQTLPITMNEAWTFLSTPANLAKITPSHMGFVITSNDVAAMYPGQIITYNIGILPGIVTGWVTEITHVEPGRYFVDEQRFGPYAMWHHEHWIEPLEGGVRMKDRVSYKLPLGPLGHLAQPFIKRQLTEIFSFRKSALEKLFPKPAL